ncbi:hypothetical protein DPMN_063471 [Dreissena polymorpha]|uniref:Uncharacterized protein n=1 Tax=Dreissena polymorpha TaxID=45954 RepID=A0A9D4CBH9_DREPO|nr:hypothetical protein DPMN_063471 [Dreissena polymorpha]
MFTNCLQTDRQTDGRTDGRRTVSDHNSSPRAIAQFAHLRGTNILDKKVNARVFTNQMWTGGRRTKTNPKTSPEQSAIFQIVREINKTNCSITRKTTPSPWQPSNKTNLFTKFHDDWANNVTSRVKLPPPPPNHVIQLTGTIFELNSCIKETNKNAPPTGVHVFSPIWTIFNLIRDINKTNVLTNFHDDWAKIVTSRVFTRKTAPPTGDHVFQRTGTTFELNQHIIKANILTNFDIDLDIIGTNLLTKFHADRTINVASRVFTNKCGRTDGRRTKTGLKSSPEQSGELKIG